MQNASRLPWRRSSDTWLRAKKELTGTLRLTCPTTVAHRLTRTSLIEAFQARHPGLRIELVMSDHYLDLAKGEADIAIRAGQSLTKTLLAERSERHAGQFMQAARMSSVMAGRNESRTSSVTS
jgi:DNA-binding transcriptional LysR family regulator